MVRRNGLLKRILKQAINNMLNNKDEYFYMANAERDFWWYKALHEQVINTIEGKYKNKDIMILDAGCGTGGLIEKIREKGYKNVKGFDLSSDAIEICRQRGLDIFQYNLLDVLKNNKINSCDVIICNDVVCYFDESEHKAIISNFEKMLKPGGLIILNVPALNIFSGTHDKAVGIVKRFTRKMVSNMTSVDTLEIVKEVFWPFSLAIPIVSIRIYQRLLIKLMKPEHYVSDVSMPNKIINLLLYQIVKIENKLLQWKPFGSSLFVVLEKNDTLSR